MLGWFRRRHVLFGMFGRWRNERTEMTAHASVASHKLQQQQGGKPFTQGFGSRDIDIGAAAIRAILYAYSSHMSHYSEPLTLRCPFQLQGGIMGHLIRDVTES